MLFILGLFPPICHSSLRISNEDARINAGGAALTRGDKNRINVELKYLTNIKTLFHMELVEMTGENLINLSINVDDYSRQRRRSQDIDAISNGLYVDGIFQHCPNLQHLSLANTFLITNKADFPVTQSLQGGELKLSEAFIIPNFLLTVNSMP